MPSQNSKRRIEMDKLGDIKICKTYMPEAGRNVWVIKTYKSLGWMLLSTSLEPFGTAEGAIEFLASVEDISSTKSVMTAKAEARVAWLKENGHEPSIYESQQVHDLFYKEDTPACKTCKQEMNSETAVELLGANKAAEGYCSNVCYAAGHE